MADGAEATPGPNLNRILFILVRAVMILLKEARDRRKLDADLAQAFMARRDTVIDRQVTRCAVDLERAGKELRKVVGK